MSERARNTGPMLASPRCGANMAMGTETTLSSRSKKAFNTSQSQYHATRESERVNSRKRSHTRTKKI
jgi:hypothetical protein